MATQTILYELTAVLIILDHQNAGCVSRCKARQQLHRGKQWNREIQLRPLPGSLRAAIVPPCNSTNVRTIERPNPSPLTPLRTCLTRKNGSNI